jgi:arylsulfatase A-like enzyme
MVITDYQHDEESHIPLIIAKKNSNFADNEFSLYLKNNNQVFESVDIASTICGLMSIEVPRHSQGKFIDEAIQLADFDEDEKKLIYLDLRQQQQGLSLKILDCKLD